MDFSQLAVQRYSLRKFDTRPVDEEKLVACPIAFHPGTASFHCGKLVIYYQKG